MMRETQRNIPLRSKWERTRNQSFQVPWMWCLPGVTVLAVTSIHRSNPATRAVLSFPAADLRAVVITVSRLAAVVWGWAKRSLTTTLSVQNRCIRLLFHLWLCLTLSFWFQIPAAPPHSTTFLPSTSLSLSLSE